MEGGLEKRKCSKCNRELVEGYLGITHDGITHPSMGPFPMCPKCGWYVINNTFMKRNFHFLADKLGALFVIGNQAIIRLNRDDLEELVILTTDAIKKHDEIVKE